MRFRMKFWLIFWERYFDNMLGTQKLNIISAYYFVKYLLLLKLNKYPCMINQDFVLPLVDTEKKKLWLVSPSADIKSGLKVKRDKGFPRENPLRIPVTHNLSLVQIPMY